MKDLAGTALDDADKPGSRLSALIDERNGRNPQYELDVRAYATNYEADKYPDVEAFIQDAEALKSVIDINNLAKGLVEVNGHSA